MSFPIDYNSLHSLMLSSDPPTIPYDVTFLISNQEKELQGEVPGHKFIFSLNSPVFRSSFCGTGDFAGKNDKMVEITGTLQAFRLMTNFLYNKPTTFDELSVVEIFDVVDLAHCYNIAKLEEALEQHLGKYLVTKNSVIEVAKTAEEFAEFKMASQALLWNCAKTLQKELPDTKAFTEFSSQVAGSGDEAVCLKLFSMMNDLQPLACSNCQQSPCISGTEITSAAQVRVGTRLAFNANHPNYRGLDCDFGSSEVVSVDASMGTVRIKAGDGSKKFDTAGDYGVNEDGNWNFSYAC